MVLPKTAVTDDLIVGEYTEIFTTGFPRSGNSWIGRLLSDILSSPWQESPGAPIRFYGPDEIGSFVIRKRHTTERLPGPVVFVYRDPRDVCVSAHFYYGHISMESTIRFMTGQIRQDIDFYGNYETFVRYLWEDPNRYTVAIQYESLHTNPVFVLSNLIRQLTGLEFPRYHIEEAFERQRFGDILARFPIYEHSMRRGIVGDWSNHFTRDDGRLFQEHFGRLMLDQGYIEDGDWWEEL